MFVQYSDKRLNRAIIEASLRRDERVVCENATVIADKNGNITGWLDNNVPVCLIAKDK